MTRLMLVLFLAIPALAQDVLPPAISSLTPPSTTSGSVGFTLVVNGSRFTPQSKVVWRYGALNALSLPTVYVSESRVEAVVSQALLDPPGTVRIAVIQGEQASNVVDFQVFAGLTVATGCPIPNAIVGQAYSFKFSLSGGIPPYVWSLGAGNFPPGLNLAGDGTLSGSATAAAQTSFVVRVTDAQQSVATKTCSMKSVAGSQGQSLFITSLDPASVLSGSGDTQVTIRGTGFVTGVVAVWNAGTGAPSDLATTFVDPTQIKATIPKALLVARAVIPIAVRKVNLTAQEFSNAESFSIIGGPEITTGCPLTDGSISAPYAQALTASGGFPPYRWTLAAGQLPPGVLLAGGGQLTGTPTEPGSYSFTLQATDAQSNIATRSCAVRILAPLSATPNTLTFNMEAGGVAPPAQFVSVSAGAPDIAFTVQASANGGGWLTAPAAPTRTPGLVEIRVTNASALAAGVYTGTVTVSSAVTSNRTVSFPVTLNVAPGRAAGLVFAPTAVNFVAQRDAAVPLTRMVAVNNPGGAALLYNAASTASWLTVTPASGTAPAGSPTMMRLRVNPAGLDPGTYTAQVTLSSSGVASPAPLQVTLSISFGSQLLSAEPSGLTFTAVQGGAAPLPQRLYITGAAANTFFWEASASTLSGGDWLSVDPPSDASRPDSPSAAQVRVNTSSLAPGIYFGELRVSSPGADNSPRLVNVALQVLPQASAVNTIQPGGMIFTGAATRQTIRVRNLGATATTVNFAVAGDTNIFTVTTAEGRNIGPGQERAFDVVATPAGLTAGVYRARIHFQFGNEPQIRAVDAVLVAAEAATCTPTRLLPMVMNQATPFAMTIGLPLPLEVQVVDDCGNPMAAGGSVTIAGNPAAAGTAALRYVQNGLWAGAWPARGGPVGLTFTADDPSRNLQGTVTLGGSGSTSANIPVIAEGGLVSAASLQAGGPLAPGGLISAFGANFVDGQWIPPALPLPSVLGNSRLMMSGADTALFYAGAGQMNAQLPYDAPPNVVRQFAVQSGTRRSHYVEMPVALAQPGVFTFDQSGKGQAIVVDGANPALIATPANPVARGGVAVIYAEGLGAVNQPVVAGTAAPVDPLARVVNTMAVTIGGRPAQVLFAGLTPGFTGLYQVNVTVPADAAPGNAVPVVVTVGGQASNAVTMAVR